MVTLQAGAFGLADEPNGTPAVEKIAVAGAGRVQFTGYEQAASGGVDLGKARLLFPPDAVSANPRTWR